MSESLKMLKTKEGQLNAVFACFGSAAQHAQLFEEEMRRFLGAYNKLSKSHIDVDVFANTSPEDGKKTMGALLRQIRKHVKFQPEAIDTKLSDVLDQRNFLAHHFFLKREKKFETKQGRMEMLRELVQIEQQLDTARGWIAGLRIAMIQTVSGKPTRTDPTDENPVFSAEIDLPDD